MSLRGGTQKAKKYGTPTTPTTPTTPKPPSPKQPKIVQTTPAGTPVVSSGTPKEARPSPRTEFKVGDVIVTGFQRTPTAIEADIQAEYRKMTTGFAKTLGLDFNAMASSVKKIQSIFSQMEQNKQHMDLISRDAFGRGFFQSQRDDWYAHEEKNKQLEKEIENIQAQEVNNQQREVVNQVISSINNNEIVAPEWFQQSISWVQSGHMSHQEFLDSYEHLTNQGLIHPPIIEEEIITEEIETKETWWVVRPSGIIEELTVTQKFVDTMTAKGWVFSKDKPTIEEPQNQNISVVFYMGTGGDLKTHFGIDSIIVTPDEAPQLGGWLHEHYNTKIILVMNRLTDDIRTHTLQQIKDLIVQKLKDDKPTSPDITEIDIKKPLDTGIMGAGVTGAIGILILLGFVADKWKK